MPNNPVAPAFVVPTLRKVREGWGSLSIADASEIKSPGPPAACPAKAGSSPVFQTGSER